MQVPPIPVAVAYPRILEEERYCPENYNVRSLSDRWVCVQCRFKPDERFFLISPEGGTVCYGGDVAESYKMPAKKQRTEDFAPFTRCSLEECPDSLVFLHRLAQEKIPRVMARSLGWAATLMESGTLVVEFYTHVKVTLKDKKFSIELDAQMENFCYEDLRTEVLQIQKFCEDHILPPKKTKGIPMCKVDCFTKNIERGEYEVNKFSLRYLIDKIVVYL